MERVALYLRKSRQDLEAEARGEGETLAKHKTALLKLAKQQGLNIVRIFEEIASGESLIHRPQMLELLKEIEAGSFDATLVMDVDRLGRGNMREQGLILETFQKSNTKIITPRKVYDLNDEWDEEYSEFESFMARRELKIITRRLQRGRVASIKEGNYIGTRPPYGYLIEERSGGRVLIPHPEQAPVVKMIFDWYTHNDSDRRMGSSNIAHELNRLGILSYTGKTWEPSIVRIILKNAVYTGRIQWRKKEYTKSAEPGKRNNSRVRPPEEWIDAEGKHEPLISEETFRAAQEIIAHRGHPPYFTGELKNPLAGLVKCAKCGFSMVLRPYGKQRPHLICQNRLCNNRSTRFDFVEEQLLDILSEWLAGYQAKWGQYKPSGEKVNQGRMVQAKKAALEHQQREMTELEKQKERLHGFLERGVYDEETYLERSRSLAERIDAARDAVAYADRSLEEEARRERAQGEIIPRVKHVLELYNKIDDIKKKNTLLKSVIDQATYLKEPHQRGDDFSLTIFPKLPGKPRT